MPLPASSEQSAPVSCCSDWLVVYAIAPDYGTDYFVWCFVFAVAAIVVCVFLQIYLWCRKPKPQPEWVPHGAIANPPGENWFAETATSYGSASVTGGNVLFQSAIPDDAKL